MDLRGSWHEEQFLLLLLKESKNGDEREGVCLCCAATVLTHTFREKGANMLTWPPPPCQWTRSDVKIKSQRYQSSRLVSPWRVRICLCCGLTFPTDAAPAAISPWNCPWVRGQQTGRRSPSLRPGRSETLASSSLAVAKLPAPSRF